MRHPRALPCPSVPPLLRPRPTCAAWALVQSVSRRLESRHGGWLLTPLNLEVPRMASRIPLASYHTALTTPPGAELRGIRQHLRLTQTGFARRLGVHAVSLGRWETGTRPVPATVMRLARCLALMHVPHQAFIPDNGNPDEPIVHVEPGTDRCHWPRGDGVACGGATYRLLCRLSRRRCLVTTACRQHLWPAYEAVETRIIAKVRAERHRQRRLRAQRERQRRAREAATPPTPKAG
jgi:DNA-binding XRE family transcriptional regulator